MELEKKFYFSVGCHCNAAGYFIGMPGPGGGEGGDYYCDANFVGGQWCPEYDTLESNKHTIAGTLHTCNGGPGYWSDCDRGGCQNNAFYVDSNMFCPEDRWVNKIYICRNEKDLVLLRNKQPLDCPSILSACLVPFTSRALLLTNFTTKDWKI